MTIKLTSYLFSPSPMENGSQRRSVSRSLITSWTCMRAYPKDRTCLISEPETTAEDNTPKENREA